MPPAQASDGWRASRAERTAPSAAPKGRFNPSPRLAEGQFKGQDAFPQSTSHTGLTGEKDLCKIKSGKRRPSGTKKLHFLLFLITSNSQSRREEGERVAGAGRNVLSRTMS